MNALIRIPLFLCLMLAGSLFGQPGSRNLSVLADKFTRNVTHHLQEKVFVDTDKTIYTTGETIWLSAWCVDAAFHTPIDLSKVLYLEVLDTSGQAWIQEKIKLTVGRGTGQLFLSADLPTGTYTLSAYTSWMKNLDPGLFFHTPIFLYNPLTNESQIPSESQESSLSIRFFPEGGNWVNGLNSRVAVETVSPAGPHALTGSIQDSLGKVVAEFQTHDKGIGLFEMIPVAGMTYTVCYTFQGDSLQFPVSPAVLHEGWTLSASQKNGKWIVSASHTDDSPQATYLTVQSRGRMRATRFQVTRSGKAIFEIPGDSLLPGISQITLFDEVLRPVCERLIFTPADSKVQLQVTPQKARVGKRAAFDIQLTHSAVERLDASVSIYKYEAGLDLQTHSIVSNLLINSDLTQAIPRVDRYVHAADSATLTELDHLLMIRGWRRFDWPEVIADSPKRLTSPPELYVPTLTGVINPGNHPLPDKILAISPGQSAAIHATRVDSSGRFFLQLSPKLQSGQLLFWRNDLPGEKPDIRLQSPFSSRNRSAYVHPFSLPESARTFLNTLSYNSQLANSYVSATHIRGTEGEIQENQAPFYGNPDVQYHLDAYTRFPTMEEVMLEYIREVAIRRSQKARHLYVYDHYASLNTVASNLMFSNPALLMIDGVPLVAAESVLEFDPLKVEDIHIVYRRFRTGEAEFDGVINLISYNKNFGGQDLPPHINQQLYQALQQTREFYAPIYDTPENILNRVPDFRSTLLWNSQVNIPTDQPLTLKGFSGDDTGMYRIEVNGLTPGGVPVYGNASLEVTGEE